MGHMGHRQAFSRKHISGYICSATNKEFNIEINEYYKMLLKKEEKEKRKEQKIQV